MITETEINNKEKYSLEEEGSGNTDIEGKTRPKIRIHRANRKRWTMIKDCDEFGEGLEEEKR